MLGLWPVADIRAAEDAFMRHLPGEVLMQRAAAGVAAHAARVLPGVYGKRVALLVGAGHNGGDTLHAGARLAARGAQVTALLLSPDRAHAGGLAALLGASGRAMTALDSGGNATRAALRVVERSDLVLDGIVGIGGRGGLRPGAAALADEAWDSGAYRIAVDLPSGVDADTGEVPGEAFEADLTVTFGGRKPGLFVGAGRQYCGDVRLVDIGLGPHLPAPAVRALEAPDVAHLLPTPRPDDDKYSRGVVGVVAGSDRYTGAAVLCVGAAAHGGAGMVRYVGSAAEVVRSLLPHAVVSEDRPAKAGRVQAWAVGPGMGTDDAAMDLLCEVLAGDVPVLVDADGITMVARRPDLVRSRTAPTVLTPHDREFERIWGPVGPDRIAAARRAAADIGAAVLLKGDVTVIARPDGMVYLNLTGVPWLATAGSGDVLTGLGGGILASRAGGAGGAGADPAVGMACAAYVHGVAGELAGVGCDASDVLAAVPGALRQILE